MKKITFEIPIKTSTPGNSRVHWAVAAKAARTQRNIAMRYTGLYAPNITMPAEVTLTRLSSGKCDRHNLPGTMKHVIDGIADAAGVDDGDDGWTFICNQEKAKRGVQAVRVVIEMKGESK